MQAGTESVWLAGNEGSVAVWQLDITRASSKGKERAQNDNNVVGTAEEVCNFRVFDTGSPASLIGLLDDSGRVSIGSIQRNTR